MIFNMTGGGRKPPVIPEYTGTMNVVYLNSDGSSGYMEFTSSGTLTWIGKGAPREKFDLFCVGGGGGSTSGFASGMYYGGVPGGGGYTATSKGKNLPESVEINIGAGGTAGSRAGNNETPAGKGGTTSIGDLLSAEGGDGATWTTPGNGGSGGGARIAATSSTIGNAGGTNGGDGEGGGGKGQGTPTTDLLGRIHAGGGASGNVKNSSEVSGGASDFTAGRGGCGARGGGGYGGGAGGKNQSASTSNSVGDAGGQGFAMIAWGDYAKLYEGGVE